MKKLKILANQQLFIIALILLSNCTVGKKVDNANDNARSEQSTLNPKKYVNSDNDKENGRQSDIDKYTGVWLFTINGKSTESGEISTELKAQKRVFIKKTNNNRLSFESCDPLDIFSDPSDPGFSVFSDSINETRLNGVGNNVAFTLNFTTDHTATGTSHFTEGSFESYEYIEAEKISTSQIFESKDDKTINVSELISENKSLISAPSEFSINCFSMNKSTTFYTYSEKKLVNFIINGEDRIITSRVLTVQGVDSEDNTLLIDTWTSDAPEIFSTIISVLYTNSQSIEHSADFFILDDEKNPEDTDVKAEISGTINIERSSASINIVADDKEGNSATADFLLNYQLPP